MTDWFRSWHGAPTDPKWLGIARRAGVAPGIAVAVAWALMDRASQAEERGSIVGYDADGLACFFGCEPEQIDQIVTAMADKGMIVDGRFTSWEKRQPKREDGSPERSKAWRERNRTQQNADKRPEAEGEADTEIAEADASGADAPIAEPDCKQILWTEGKLYLESHGVTAAKAGSMIGRWLRDCREDHGRVLGAINRAREHGTGDPIPFVTQLLSPKASHEHRSQAPKHALSSAFDRLSEHARRLEDAGIPASGREG